MANNPLNAERKRQGLSVAELAKKANLPKATVEKVLFGIVKNPRIDTMIAIEKALSIQETITPEEYAQGVRMTKQVQITADDEDILDKFHEVQETLNGNGKNLIIDFCNVLIEHFKK